MALYYRANPDLPNPMTQLYRHWDDAGTLLYVGISRSTAARLAQHGASPWSDLIAAITVEQHPTREAALVAESLAIQNEKPLFNVVGRI